MRRRGAQSIVARILWLHGFAVVITAIVVSTTIYLFLDSTADRLQRQTLLVHAGALADDLELARDGRLRLRPDLASASLYGGGSGLSFVIVDERATLLFGSPPSPVLPTANVPRQRAIASFRRQSRRAIYSGVSLPKRIGSHRVWVATIQNLEHPDYIVDDIIAEFLIYGVAIILPLLLVLLAFDYAIIRRALRSVVAASARVQALDRRRLDVRLPVEELPTEVRPLVEAANDAFDRLVASYRIQRDFTADAAHELRTPLTIIRMRVQAIEDEGLARELRGDIDVLTRIVNQLLEIAELDITDAPISDRVDLHAIAVEGVAAIAPLAYREGKTIAVAAAGAPVWIAGEADLIARALGALLENAVKHTARGTAIEVRVSDDGRLEVWDDGGGIAQADQAFVFERFWRRDRGRSANAGLGLAIVARIAEAHRTSVVLRSEPGVGTSFSISFATAPPTGADRPSPDGATRA